MALGIPACYDTEPVVVEDPPGRDAAADGAPLSACQVCVRAELDGQTEACSAERSACAGLARCPPAMECLFGDGCLGLPVREIVGCAVPCGERMGVTGIEDPLIDVAFSFAACLSGACAADCQ
jgi:hypothetical protein